jgi:outer membrane protein OmpA-like peptidoglycan-associated protein
MTPFRTMTVAAIGLAAAACASDSKVTRDQIVVAASSCQDTSFPIYFETGSAKLTAPAMQLLRESTAQAKRCAVKEVLVLGLADADGSAARNMALSRERASSVAAALAAQGLPAPTFDLEAAGASGAVTPAGAPEPLRRRAEVVIRLGPDQTAERARGSRRR